MLVTLAIFGIMMALLSQSLILNININRKAFYRSRIREELSDVVGQIERDIRNSSIISTCGVDGQTNENKCQITHVSTLTWTDNCPSLGTGIKSICKKDVNGKVQFQSSEIINIESVTFDILQSSGTDASKATVYVTIIASAVNPSLTITNQIRQVAISTRNFTI